MIKVIMVIPYFLGFVFAEPGCTDMEAYNCEDDIWVEGEEYPNYTFLVGTVPYINGCNYDMDPYYANQVIEVGGCESESGCVGFYDPEATTDDGSCDYWQSPGAADVIFIVEENGISVDWSSFTPPSNAIVSGYNVSRCTGMCDFITGNPFPGGWANGGNTYTETSIFDEFDWGLALDECDGVPNSEEDCEGKVKYAINVRYSNAESYGMALGTTYVTPSMMAIEETPVPFSYNLQPAYPNPFNPVVHINFDISLARDIWVDIFDISGVHIEALHSGFLHSGSHEMSWNAEFMSSGVYIISLKAGSEIRTQKVMLLK